MKKLLISLTVLMVAGFSLSSCLKEAKVQDPGFNVSETGNNATALLELPLDVYLQADRAIRSQRDSIKAKNINQASFTFKIGYISLTVSPADTTTYPKTILLDFGSDPITAIKPYQGKMSIIMSGNMRNDKSTCAITYQNLILNNSNITGNDLIISLGTNSSGSVISHFIMNGGELKGYNSEKVAYTGNVIGKYNLASNINVLDSVEINATDANLNAYKLYSIPSYKLQIAKGCYYFNTGGINTNVKINGVLTGILAYDFGYSSQGYTNACDPDGIVYITSKINTNYQQSAQFGAMAFQ